MKSTLMTAVLISALTLPAHYAAAAADLGSESRKNIRLTFYNNGLALIDDQRRGELKKGINSLNITGISPSMIVDSARVTSEGKISVREQSYLGKNLSHRDLLEAHIGKAVKIALTNPDTGEDTVRDAVLLSADQGLIVRIGNQIEINPPGRIVFPALPSDMRAEPVFRISGETFMDGPIDLGLAYLSNGFSWSASHTLTLNGTNQIMNLETWATLNNNSGLSINEADIQIIAGTVQRRSPETPRPQRKEMRMLSSAAPMMDAGSGAPVRQSVGGFHLYTLPNSVNLHDKSSKQVALLKTLSLPVTRTLISQSQANPYAPAGGAPRPTHPLIRLTFLNDKTTGPGEPIPGGIARVYGKDAEGRTQFLGEDHLKDLPIGAGANITVGRAFDVTVTRVQTDFVKEGLGRNTVQMADRIHITNGGDTPQQVEVIEAQNGDWKILDENAAHLKENNRAKWSVSVPAKGDAEVTYRVQTRR